MAANTKSDFTVLRILQRTDAHSDVFRNAMKPNVRTVKGVSVRIDASGGRGPFMRSRCANLALVLSLLAVPAAAEAPVPSALRAKAPAERSSRQIWAAAQAARAGQLALLETLVNIDTGTGDVEGARAAGAILEARMRAIGMSVERVPAEAPGLPDNMVGRLAGSGKTRILLIAHIDTVFEPGTAKRRPYTVDGQIARGPGVSDEKAGVVAGLAALEILQAKGLKSFGSVTFLIDTSEEKGSMGSRALIGRLVRESDVVLNLEPAQPPDGVVVWRKGSGTFHIAVKGRAAHAGVAPQDGRNAAVELLHQLEALKGLPNAGEELTANLTVLQAGGRTNIIPDAATAAINVRARRKAEFEALEATLRRNAAAPSVAGTEVSVRFDPSFPPLSPNPASDALAVRAQAIYREIGLTLGAGGNGGGSESALAYEAGVPVLDGLGPLGGGFHSEDEFLDLASVTPRLYLLTRLIMDLSANPP